MGSIKFGTDGWRAVIAEDFTFSNLKAVAQAVADYIKKNFKHNSSIALGYDGRFLSKEFAYAAAEVFSANNIKVFLSAELIPTPLVSFITKTRGLSLGVMITASHNPYRFNGFKIKKATGGAADKAVTNEVERLLFRTKVKSVSRPSLLKVENFSPSYIKFIRSYIDLSRCRSMKLKILVDLMHGSGGYFLKEVFKNNKNIQIDYLRDDFNPSFGGTSPEPLPKNLKPLTEKMKGSSYDLGIALDGDGDRIACVLPGGRFLSAQVLLPLLALHLADNRKLSGGIVKTVVGSNLIDKVALSLGRILYETPVGFKYISSLFEKEDILIGGEEAGGIGFKNYIPERDGNVAAALLVEYMSYEKKPLVCLVQDMEKRFGRWYYDKTSIPIARVKHFSLTKIKAPSAILKERVERINRIDGVKFITKSSWLMLRASGTEPIVRVYAEARSLPRTKKLLELGKSIIYAL